MKTEAEKQERRDRRRVEAAARIFRAGRRRYVNALLDEVERTTGTRPRQVVKAGAPGSAPVERYERMHIRGKEKR